MADYQLLRDTFKGLLDIRVIVTASVIFLTFSWAVRSYLNQIKNLPPGPRGWPVVGCAPELLTEGKSFYELLQSLSNKYGPVCYLPAPFGKSVVVISGYQAVHAALTCYEFDWRPPKIRPEDRNGLGVIMASGDLWKEHRRFSLAVLRGFGVGKRSFEDQIVTESDCMMREIKSHEGQPFDPTHLLCNAVSNIICSVVMGKRFEYDDHEFKLLLHLLEDSISHLGVAIARRFVPFAKKIPFFPNDGQTSATLLLQKLKDIVDEHRATIDEENLRDFIDVYINDMRVKKEQSIQTHFSDTGLIAVVRDFFLAGTETSSTTLRWALLYMVCFPEVQQRVYEEIDGVVGRDRLPKLSDKPKLPYTVAVIHEVQRFASIVHQTAPRYNNQDVEFQGFTIPKGSYIISNLYSVTRDTLIWKKPDVFQPERFLDENGQVVKIPEEMVFGAGKRVCLGEQLARMELFIFFTHLMHQFSFKKPTDTESLDIRPKPAGVLAPFPYHICAITRT